MNATCPMCGSAYDNRDTKSEPIYTCIECGRKGFDCCIAGSRAKCENCINLEFEEAD
jgi:hypothetical protein